MPPGRNFGAGMSNGVAYVFDESETFAGRLNHEMVLLADRRADARSGAGSERRFEIEVEAPPFVGIQSAR